MLLIWHVVGQTRVCLVSYVAAIFMRQVIKTTEIFVLKRCLTRVESSIYFWLNICDLDNIFGDDEWINERNTRVHEICVHQISIFIVKKSGKATHTPLRRFKTSRIITSKWFEYYDVSKCTLYAMCCRVLACKNVVIFEEDDTEVRQTCYGNGSQNDNRWTA